MKKEKNGKNAKDIAKELDAFYSQLLGASEKNGTVESRDVISMIQTETHVTKDGIKYLVIKREDQPILILHLNHAIDLSRALKRRRSEY